MKKEIDILKKAKKKMLAQVPLLLDEMILSLKKLVSEEKIESFSFLQNTMFLDNQRPIYISVSGKVGESLNDLRLGVFDGTRFTKYCKDRKFQLEEDLQLELKEINANLYFLNDNLIKKLPLIDKTTWFSEKSVNKLDGFAKENIPLLPNFHKEKVKKIKKNKM